MGDMWLPDVSNQDQVKVTATKTGTAGGQNIGSQNVNLTGSIPGVKNGAAIADSTYAIATTMTDSGGVDRPMAAALYGLETTHVRLKSVNTGQLVVTQKSSTGTEPTIATGMSTDAVAVTNTALVTISAGYGFDGTAMQRLRVANVNKSYANTLAALASGAVWTPAAGKKFRLMFLMLSCDTSVQMLIQDAGTTLVQVKLLAGTPMVLPMPANGILSSAINNALNVKNNDGAASSVIYALALGVEE